MTRLLLRVLIPCFVYMIAVPVGAADVASPPPVSVSTSSPTPTPAPLNNPFESKLRMEDSVEVNNPFGVVPHRPNYLLPYSYNTRPNQDAFRNPGKPYSGSRKASCNNLITSTASARIKARPARPRKAPSSSPRLPT